MTEICLLCANHWQLGGWALLTSMIAGVFGLGGGMMLMLILPAYITPAQLIPLHGSSQLASNLSRVWLVRKSVVWTYFTPFILGSLIGVGTFSLLINAIPVAALPKIIAVYLLISLWIPQVNIWLSQSGSFFWIGAVQSGASLVVGATSPLTNHRLYQLGLSSHQVIATGGLMMSVSHSLKLLMFLWLDFNYLAYLPEVFWLVTGAIAGSWLGTQVRSKLTEETFKTGFRLILTGLAIKMLLGW